MQKLGKNINGYFGERIDLGAVQRDCLAAAAAHGWAVEEIHPAPRHILGLRRRHTSANAGKSEPESHGRPAPRVYISAGVHGDEPAGPLAACQLLQQNAWPHGVDLWLCPWLNPTGVETGRRENREGLDLNRQYRSPVATETIRHVDWLQRQPAFDLCLCLHEDWESNGFYVYEQNPEQRPSLGETIVHAVSQVCPIDWSDLIEGRPAKGGIIRPNLDPRSRPEWPEAFFLITHKTRLSYTLEAPSDFPLPTRVAALVGAVNTAVGMIAAQ